MMFERFWLGFGFIRAGMSQIRRSKKLMLLAAIPFAIVMTVFFWGLSSGGAALSAVVVTALEYVFTTPEGWLYGIFYYPLLILFWIVFLVCLSAATYLVASVISAPFNGLMAEEVLQKRGLIAERPFSLKRMILTGIRMFFISLVRSLFLLAIGLVLFIASFLPGVNILTSYFTFMLMAFDATDYAMEAAEFSLHARLRFFRENFAEYMGMGAIVGLVALIPGVIILMMPFSVIGAADVVAVKLKERETL